MSKSKIPKDVNEYIAAAPEPTRAKLMQLRKIIKTTSPQAEEVISYHMPYYKDHGHLVGFAAYKDHVSLFGAFPKRLDQDSSRTKPAEAASSSHWTSPFQGR